LVFAKAFEQLRYLLFPSSNRIEFPPPFFGSLLPGLRGLCVPLKSLAASTGSFLPFSTENHLFRLRRKHRPPFRILFDAQNSLLLPPMEVPSPLATCNFFLTQRRHPHFPFRPVLCRRPLFPLPKQDAFYLSLAVRRDRDRELPPLFEPCSFIRSSDNKLSPLQFPSSFSRPSPLSLSSSRPFCFPLFPLGKSM